MKTNNLNQLIELLNDIIYIAKSNCLVDIVNSYDETELFEEGYLAKLTILIPNSKLSINFFYRDDLITQLEFSDSYFAKVEFPELYNFVGNWADSKALIKKLFC